MIWNPQDEKRFSISRLLVLTTVMALVLHGLIQTRMIIPSVLFNYYENSAPGGKFSIVAITSLVLIYLFGTAAWAVLRLPNLVQCMRHHRQQSIQRRADILRELEQKTKPKSPQP